MDALSYPIGLRLAGRKVLLAGGGQVAQRRVPSLLAAGADLVLVSPQLTPALEGMTAEFTWLQREFESADLADAWLVLATTNDPAVNAKISKLAASQKIFCIQADSASSSTAWTPAVARHDGMTVAVLGNREPKRSAELRNQILTALQDGVLKSGEPSAKQPRVLLIGGGPGDPELITVAGLRALISADVVIADRLAPRELLELVPASTELVDVAKLPRGRSATQEQINELLISRVQAGKVVARFKGGDNFVFGRGYEEIQACAAAGVAVEIIPGVTSAVSVPALAGIPVTHRGVAHEFCVISGHLPPGHPDSLINWEALAQLSGTLVLLMAVENAPQIAAALIKAGKDPSTPVAILTQGSMPTAASQRLTLAELPELAVTVTPPAIIVIGNVVSISDATD